MNEMMNFENELTETELEDVNGGGFLTAAAVYGAIIAGSYCLGWATGKILKKKTGVCY